MLPRTDSSHFDVVIVGAGQAGAQAAATLRTHKFEGSIALIGAEPDIPYERPPLSKEYLSGEKTFERILIRSPAFWDERDIVLQTGRTVVSVGPQSHTVQLADGARIGYRHLVWATGGSVRRLTCPGYDLAGVHGVRTRGDVDRIMAELPAVQRVVVVGGGYVGLEAAAVLTKLGKQVVVLEAQERVLARVAGLPLSRFYEQEHRAHGVDVRLSVTVVGVEGENGRATGVRLDDGTVLPADMVIVGIGIIPAVEPLLAAGAVGGNGVAVDAQCRTSLPDIYAIGDCALHANLYADGAMIRLESVQNANDQATIAAQAVLGGNAEYDSIPWFWSNQYDLTLQTVGLSGGHDHVVVRGDMATRRFSLVYYRHGKIIALDCVNAIKDFIQGKALVKAGARIDPDRVADAATPLKEMVC